MKNIAILSTVAIALILAAFGVPKYQSIQQAELARDSEYVTHLARQNALSAIEENAPKIAIVQNGWFSDIPNIEEEYLENCLYALIKDEILIGNTDAIVEENKIGSRPNNTILYAEIFNLETVKLIKERGAQFPNAKCL